MTSEERREGRYQRRKARRAEKRARAIAEYDNYDNIISANALLDAARQSRKSIRFKASVQRYFMNLMRNTWDLHRKLSREDDVTMGFICFTLCERGKTRFVRSVHFKERVVQRALCDRALVPVIARSLDYDNGASVKGKGIHFSIQRCRAHLQQYYRANGFSNEGWVLQIDFKGYFDSIQHDPVMQMVDRMFEDKRIVRMTERFVRCFGAQSLGIGSQVSQILAVSYPNAVDHYIRQVLHLRFGGRYMDDSYYFHHDRAYLAECLEKLKTQFEPLGIRLNMKKTQIIPIQHFTFLKVRFHLTESGRVVMKPCRDSVTRMRSKLKAFSGMIAKGELTRTDAHRAYQSWRGYVGHVNSHKTILTMDQLYKKLITEGVNSHVCLPG